MYHLSEMTYWYNDYNINLDSAGVWGTQGPLGVSGALGILGALGPTGFSLQAGITTTSDGKYMTLSSGKSVVIRQTQPIRYSHDSTISRIYDLFEMYSRTYAKSMCSALSSTSSCDVNDSSFGVDASTVLKQKYYEENEGNEGENENGNNKEEEDSSLFVENGVTAGVDDKYSFTSKYNQFVHINLILYGGTPGLPGQITGGSWDNINMTLSLSCGTSSSNKKTLHTTTNNFISTSTSTTQNDLIPFITTRLKKNELCDISISIRIDTGKDTSTTNDWTGYYLFVTGSGLQVISQGVTNSNPDIWGLRKQIDGRYSFNMNGLHQTWIPF